MGKKLKIMSAQNISINEVEGEQVRIDIVFDESLTPGDYTVTGGNTVCPEHQLVFTATTDGQTVHLVSNKLEYVCQPVAFQVFVKRKSDGAEWNPLNGSIRITKRIYNDPA